jgi:hypothetical protein
MKLQTGSVAFGVAIMVVFFLLFIKIFWRPIIDAEVERKLAEPLPETWLCNDASCHPNKIIDPPILGKRFYYGKWSIDPKYLVNEIDTSGNTISIYPDKIALPDTIEFPILIDASHGHSIDPKYIQMWTVSGLKWMKLSERSSDWIARSDVIRRLK